MSAVAAAFLESSHLSPNWRARSLGLACGSRAALMDDADKPADAHPPLKTPVYILPISARLILGMNRTFKAAVTGLMLTVCFAGPLAAGPFEDAVAARDKIDFATALSLLRPLAEQGSANAQFNLGFMYENGQGVPQDDAAAMSWYRKAAEQGFAMAQLGLGVMYVDGRGGVPQDYDTAVSWYRKAAEQGNALGQLGLGLMYASGRGVPQDYVTAHMWLNLAAGSGDKVAAEGRERLAQQMTPAQIAEAQKLAREWRPTSTPAFR
jgi:TPR repeat protein